MSSRFTRKKSKGKSLSKSPLKSKDEIINEIIINAKQTSKDKYGTEDKYTYYIDSAKRLAIDSYKNNNSTRKVKLLFKSITNISSIYNLKLEKLPLKILKKINTILDPIGKPVKGKYIWTPISKKKEPRNRDTIKVSDAFHDMKNKLANEDRRTKTIEGLRSNTNELINKLTNAEIDEFDEFEKISKELPTPPKLTPVKPPKPPKSPRKSIKNKSKSKSKSKSMSK
jgi:hypothetical protein